MGNCDILGRVLAPFRAPPPKTGLRAIGRERGCGDSELLVGFQGRRRRRLAPAFRGLRRGTQRGVRGAVKVRGGGRGDGAG